MMCNALCRYKDAEGNYYYTVMLHKTSHFTSGATYSSPRLCRMLTSVNRTRGFCHIYMMHKLLCKYKGA